MEFLFSFGSSQQFPFQGGYIIINASDSKKAVNEYRKRYPDRTPGILNCSDIYTNPDTIQDFKQNGNLGAGCHAYINLYLPEFCYTVMPTGEFALIRRSESGYHPINANLEHCPDISDLADKLNRQFGISKSQERAMRAGAVAGWDVPEASPQYYENRKKQIFVNKE